MGERAFARAKVTSNTGIVMPSDSDLLGAIETHGVEVLRSLLGAGASAVNTINGFTPVEYLTSGYLRSSRFVACLGILLEAGGVLQDAEVRAVLLDDSAALERLLRANGNTVVQKRVSMRAAFTRCHEVSLLHLCAEFNSMRCARVLLEAGADANAAAGIDEHGFGGQTPIFHAVNSNQNYCRPAMELLVKHRANLDVSVAGLVWGQDMSWETAILSVNPLSYAQCGLYRQFHRREADVYSNLAYLYEHRYGKVLRVQNVPNKYLA